VAAPKSSVFSRRHVPCGKAFTKRIEALVREDADPEAGRVAIREHV
jgi:hypothetical protein